MALLSWLLIITACLFGLVSGLREGMVMIQVHDRMANHWSYDMGVRCHKWYNLYHIVRVTELVLAMALGAAIATFRNFLTVAGSLFMLWELFEVGYAYARWNRLWDETEHLNFFEIVDIELTHKLTITIHILRLIAGITLILTGSL